VADDVVMPLGRYLYVVTDPNNAAIGAIAPSRVAYGRQHRHVGHAVELPSHTT
jgi:hypothetical protein